MPTKSPSGLRTSEPSRLTSDTLTITLQEPCFQGILLSHYLSFLWLQRAGFSMGCSCGKTIFQALFFFPRYSLKLKQARLCKKTAFQALKNWCFHTALLKLREARLCNKTIFQALKKMFCPRYSLKLKQARLCKKTTFQALKRCFFPHGSFETQRSSALQKKQFFRRQNCFLRTNLIKFIQAWLCKKNQALKNCVFSALLS